MAISARVAPDFMTTGGLPIELESTCLELSHDFAITKAGEPAQLCCHHNGVVACTGCLWKRDIRFAFTARFNEFAGDIARNFKGLRNRPSLRHKTRQFVRGSQIDTLRQCFNLNANCEFHN